MSWQDFEERVKYIYSTLLNLRDEGVVVSRNTSIVGRSGATHQIDVYWDFTRAGIRHRVAIECKDHQKPIDKGYIQEFHAKLNDIGNVVGLVVAKNGYQEGAEIYAKHYNIETITIDQLPHMGQLLGLRLSVVALPDETYVGEPFWTIMELRNGTITGSYFITPNGNGVPHVPLFYSKLHAERAFSEAQLDKTQWAIRGLPRASLRAFSAMLELFERRGQGAMLAFLPPGARADAEFIALPLTRHDLMNEYVIPIA